MGSVVHAGVAKHAAAAVCSTQTQVHRWIVDPTLKTLRV